MREIAADYLVIGAGAMGMGFVDQLLTDAPDARIVMVDRRAAPGGHWIDGYPFLRLHQPAAYYGVNSRPLETGVIDAAGANAGLLHLAHRDEVVAYYDAVMRERFLPSGRVTFLANTEAAENGDLVSAGGARTKVAAKTLVDAARLSPEISAHHAPPYAVAAGVTLVRPNDLPAAARDGASYVIVGAGKTGMDVALWLLENGVEPARLQWIMPHDSWMLDRAHYQPGQSHLGAVLTTLANEVEAMVECTSLEDLFGRLEAKNCRLRLDPAVTPKIHRCATVSKGELDEMRRIANVVRLGYVRRIERERIRLDDGDIATAVDAIHIDCTARGINYRPTVPIFAERRITLQHVRLCQPVFSAALIGHVEASYASNDEKNAICPVVEPPSDTVGWLRMLRVELPNRSRLLMNPAINDWLAGCRLDPLAGRIRAVQPSDTHDLMAFARYMQNAPAAIEKVNALLAEIEGTAST